MGLTEWTTRLARRGVTATTPAREAKHIIVLNVVMMLNTVQNLALVVITALAGFGVLPFVMMASTITNVVILAMSGVVRRVVLEIVTIGLLSGIVATACLLTGPATRGDLYFFSLLAGTWLVFPTLRAAAMGSIVCIGTMIAVLVLYDHVTPIDAPDPATARWVVPVIIGFATFSLLGVVVWYHREAALAELYLERERARSDRLLRNVLPDRVAERLKDGPTTIADRFDEVTVLFADLVGFTTLSATLPAERVVALLNDVFTRFDELATHHRVEKIKTIGDAYMVVAGVPEPRDDHADAAAAMALDLRDAIASLGHGVQIRIGMCSGPVVAGVIGIRKFAYDLWGDTVNTAARMESHGAPGEIHVTESTYGLLRDRFTFVERGSIDVKGKGAMRTYFLEGRIG